MGLIERDDTLQRLHELLGEAADGSGRVALVRGEAGIGKTSVVKEFVSRVDGAHILWGGCDDLMAPRPLGPLWDMAFDEPALGDALAADDRQATFGAVLELLTRALQPTVMVIEDMHWADDATLDLLKFIGRRIDRTHALVIVTYRDGEAMGDHPLRVALGDLPHGMVERVQLLPLTHDGVKAMAGEGMDAGVLWELTRGNPFFVSEAVATASETVPASIRDAVLARVLRLSEDGRRLVELAAVAPSRVELDVVTSVLGDSAGAIAESEDAGILELSGDSLSFRHELARRAVEGDLPAIRRRQLNLDILQACEALGDDVSRCAHHARQAEDADAMLRILPGAARRASELESHAEALITLRALEPYLDLMTLEDLADHYDLWAWEEYLGADQGLDLIEKGLAIRRELGDASALANSLLIASRIAWVGTHRTLAIEFAEEAAAVAGEVGGDDLAMAYSVLSQLAMLGGYEQDTVEWGEKAMGLVGEGDSRIRAHALNNVGSVGMMNQRPEGLDALLESRSMSARLGLLHDEVRACVNIAWNYMTRREPATALSWIEEALHLVDNAEMPSFESYAWVMKAMWHEMIGEWEEADGICATIAEMSSSQMMAQAEAAILMAKIAIRRGSHPRVGDLISEALRRAEFSDETQRLGPAYAMFAEHAWLTGTVDRHRLERAREVMDLCFARSHAWAGSEIAYWLTAGGFLERMPDGATQPYRLMGQGQWAEAASWWAEHESPYERAVALGFGDVDARFEALRVLDDLGGLPLAARIRNQLLGEGVRGVPRGPQKATRDHDLGLTARQAEVLTLLADELTNAEIADRLFISTRTVDHHVSAILSKLGASSRSEAALLAQRA